MSNESIIYAEVYEILSYMDKLTVMKIPIEILSLFKNKRDKQYVSRIDKSDIFNKDNIEKETLETLAWLDLTYWANENEKRELLKIYSKNDEKNSISYNNIFETKEKLESISENQIIIKKESIFEKIKNLILNFIN